MKEEEGEEQGKRDEEKWEKVEHGFIQGGHLPPLESYVPPLEICALHAQTTWRPP